MKDQLWIRLRIFVLNYDHLELENHKDIAIKNYDELVAWMEKNKEMWQLITVETDYICRANNPRDNINIRNVYYVFE